MWKQKNETRRKEERGGGGTGRNGGVDREKKGWGLRETGEGQQ